MKKVENSLAGRFLLSGKAAMICTEVF